MKEFVEEICDEFTDFFEDLWELITRTHRITEIKSRQAVIGGVKLKVRPAYLFAERIENLLKIVFGFSLAISAFTSTFLGFASLGDLVDVLIRSFWGRIIMFILGMSYLIIALWKLLHLNAKRPT